VNQVRFPAELCEMECRSPRDRPQEHCEESKSKGMKVACRYPRMGMRSDGGNYYEVLHVSHDAPLEIIRGSYRTLMQQLGHHPDLGGDTKTAALINEAYATLSNAERRAEYDARLDIMEQVAKGVPGDAPAPRSPGMSERVSDLSRECVFCKSPHSFGSVIEVETGCAACGSPLYAADQSRMELEDQRSIERIGKRQKVTFYTHWPQRPGLRGHIEDMSLHGLRLVTRQELVEGQCIKIVSDVLEAVAQVKNCLHERRGWTMRCVAGVSFVTLRFGHSLGGFVSDRV